MSGRSASQKRRATAKQNMAIVVDPSEGSVAGTTNSPAIGTNIDGFARVISTL